ncbi:GNAT family N-acetyltransferase [Litorilituus lipolyticus]|uniref:N-acetyltransferase n=1 Tax=Litorilituus lipolyticus TaxID=2491017 RepID=A0A502KYS5_9GAMM|nr:GNAT family N-acetyltransferase [Litorilituus lipolyticus]TPH15121.1 N-acetyltransferase [Litorilituus lipolyticus]
MKVMNSERLSYRLMDQNDGEILWQLDQDPEVMKYISGGKINTMDDINTIFLPRMAKYTNPEQGWGLWQVCDKISQEYLGWVLVRPMDFFSDEPKYKDIELGWRFFKKAWGKGYATEAAQAIKDALVEQTDIDYVSAIALEENVGSINIMKKIGMTFLKKELHQDPLGDLDAVYYQMPTK